MVKFCVGTKVDQFVFMSALVKVIVSMLTGYLLTYCRVVCVLCGCVGYSNCMQQILESVDYCHQMNVVHRDLKVCALQTISLCLSVEAMSDKTVTINGFC